MQNLIKRLTGFRKSCMALAAITTLAFTGCEKDSNTNSDANYGEGKDNFTAQLPNYIMHRGENSEVSVEVRPNCDYEAKLTCSNDGDSDVVSILVDGKAIGTYNSVVVRHAGAGWYEFFESSPYKFTTTGEIARLGVHIAHADDWGVWPAKFSVSRVTNPN